MSISRRAEFEKQLQSGELPEITEATIESMLWGLVGQAPDFAREMAMEVWKILRPQHSDLKTNNPFRIGRRVILGWYCERAWSGTKFRVNYHRQKELHAIDGVFHLLDGKGPIKTYTGPLETAIQIASDGQGETDYFQFKCWKNHNLHLEFKRLDLVKELNLLATGEHVIG